MRSKTSIGSSREVEQDCGVSFINWLYLVPLIIDQNFYTTCTTRNQTEPSSGFFPGTVDVASGPRTTEEEGLAGRSASARQGGRGARGRPRFRGETARSAGGPGDRMDGRDALGVCDPERGETARAAGPQPRNRATCQLCRAT